MTDTIEPAKPKKTMAKLYRISVAHSKKGTAIVYRSEAHEVRRFQTRLRAMLPDTHIQVHAINYPHMTKREVADFLTTITKDLTSTGGTTVFARLESFLKFEDFDTAEKGIEALKDLPRQWLTPV